jgi:hypothetical protein
MFRIAIGVVMMLCVCWMAQGFQEPEGLLDRFLTRMKSELGRLPDYVCTQTIERFSRQSAERQWQKVDTLRFDVALVGNKELYGRPGERRFQSRTLADLVGKGTTSTGQLGILAKHVFLTSTAQHAYKGASEQDGRRVHEYQYEVAPERSSYRLRNGNAESAVGFQGAFWFDAETLDLIRLEVQAFDIPEKLGLAEANTSLGYARVAIDDGEVLLPVSATLMIASLDGSEDQNRMRLTTCRHYRADSNIQYAGDQTAPNPEQSSRAAARTASGDDLLPNGTVLELALDASIDPAASKIGDPVRARMAKPAKVGERIVVPQGSVVLGHLVRLEKQTMPLPVFDIALEFDTLVIGDRNIPLAVTMDEAGPAAGLLRQAKRLDPTFTRRRTGRMDVLVREVQRGQGILLWDARRGPLPSGLKMKWRVQSQPEL